MNDEQKKRFTLRVRQIMDYRFGASAVQECYDDAWQELFGETDEGSKMPCGDGTFYCDAALCHGPQWCRPNYPMCT